MSYTRFTFGLRVWAYVMSPIVTSIYKPFHVMSRAFHVHTLIGGPGIQLQCTKHRTSVSFQKRFYSSFSADGFRSQVAMFFIASSYILYLVL